jgi:hypothetical protein
MKSTKFKKARILKALRLLKQTGLDVWNIEISQDNLSKWPDEGDILDMGLDIKEMESKFMEMLHAKYAENAAAAKGNVHSNEHKDADGDMKTPAKESEGSEKEEDKRGTDANSGSQRPRATGGSNAGGDSSQTGEAGSASAGIK